MKVVVAGVGSVGQSIALELSNSGHEVLAVDNDRAACIPDRVPKARWLQADACELSSLQEAAIDTADVVVAATGDDKTNLVLSYLAKTEFGVPRTVARVNDPRNEWMFDDSWGVDVAVSTPRLMTALVEEAVTVGDLVHMFTFREGGAVLVEFTLPQHSPLVGTMVRNVDWPQETVLVGIIREGRPIAPTEDDTLEARDELMLLSTIEDDHQLRSLLTRGNTTR